MADELDIWSKLARSAELAPAVTLVPPTAETEKSSTESTKGAARFIRVMSVLSSVFWVYLFVKVFIADVDHIVLKAIAPGALFLLDYRIFFYLGLVIAIALWRRRWLLILVYVAFFPLVVVGWYLPRFFIRRKSWALFLGCLQVVFTALSDFVYNFTTKAIALLAGVLILTTRSHFLLTVSAVYLALLLITSYGRLIRKTFSEASFLTAQRSAIRRLLRSRVVTSFTSLNEAYKSTDLEFFDRNQISQVTNAISFGICINKGLFYWAYQLDRYRRGSYPAVIFSAASYAWLFVGTLMSFALMNDALLKGDPGEFGRVAHPVSFLAVTVYSLSTLFVSTGGGITPIGNIAYGLQLAAGIAGPAFLLACLLNFLVTYRRERDEAALEGLVDDLKTRAREQGERFSAEWSVSVDEARKRLEDIGEGLSILFTYFTSKVPPDFFDDNKP